MTRQIDVEALRMVHVWTGELKSEALSLSDVISPSCISVYATFNFI